MSQPKDQKQHYHHQQLKQPPRVSFDDPDQNRAAEVDLDSNRNESMTTNHTSCLGIQDSDYSANSFAADECNNSSQSNLTNPPFIALSKLRNYMTQHSPSSFQITDKLTKSNANNSFSDRPSPTIRITTRNSSACLGVSLSRRRATGSLSPTKTLVTPEATLTAAALAKRHNFSRVPNTSPEATLTTATKTTSSQERLAQARLEQNQRLLASAERWQSPTLSDTNSSLDQQTTSSFDGSSSISKLATTNTTVANKSEGEYETEKVLASKLAPGESKTIDQRPVDHLNEELHKPQRAQPQPQQQHREPIPSNRQSHNTHATVLNQVVDSCKCITQSQANSGRTVETEIPSWTKLRAKQQQQQQHQQQQQQHSERLHRARQAQQAEQSRQRELSKTPVSHRSNCIASTSKIHFRRAELSIDKDSKGSDSGRGSGCNSHLDESADSVGDCVESRHERQQQLANRESVCTEVERKRLEKTLDSCSTVARSAVVVSSSSSSSSSIATASTIIRTTSSNADSSHSTTNPITSLADIGDGTVSNQATKCCGGRNVRASVIGANNMTPGSLLLLQKSDCLEKQGQQERQQQHLQSHNSYHNSVSGSVSIPSYKISKESRLQSLELSTNGTSLKEGEEELEHQFGSQITDNNQANLSASSSPMLNNISRINNINNDDNEYAIKDSERAKSNLSCNIVRDSNSGDCQSDTIGFKHERTRIELAPESITGPTNNLTSLSFLQQRRQQEILLQQQQQNFELSSQPNNLKLPISANRSNEVNHHSSQNYTTETDISLSPKTTSATTNNLQHLTHHYQSYRPNFSASMLGQQLKLEGTLNGRNITFDESRLVASDRASNLQQPQGSIDSLTAARNFAIDHYQHHSQLHHRQQHLQTNNPLQHHQNHQQSQSQVLRNVPDIGQYYVAAAAAAATVNDYNLAPKAASKSSSPVSTTSTPSPKSKSMHIAASNISQSQEAIQSSTNSSGNLVISNSTTSATSASGSTGINSERGLNNNQMNSHYNIGSSNADQDQLHGANQHYSAYFQPVDNCGPTNQQQQQQQQLMTLANHEQMYTQVHHQQHQHQQPQQQQQQQHQQQQQQSQQQHQHQHLSNHQALYHQVANNVVGVDHGYGHATSVGMHYQGHLSQTNSSHTQQAHLMVDAHQGHLNTAAAARAAAAVVSQTLKTVANQHVQQQHYGSNGFNAATQGVGLMSVAAQHQQQFVTNNVTQQQHSQLDPSHVSVTNIHHAVDHQSSLQHDSQQRQAQQHQLQLQHHTNQLQQFQSHSQQSQHASARNQLGNPSNSVIARKYQCKMCPQSFMSKAEMKYHNQNHMREAKPYKCLQCPKAFANSSYLSQHMRIHQGVKPYSCDICTRRFTQLSHLQQHKRTHTGDKPYKCTYLNCTKQFSQLSNLQSHSRCHQLDKPYKCNSCYKCFHDEQSLLEHIPRHLESKHLKKNLCIFCGSSYQQERGLVKHFQQYHTDKSPTLVAAAIAAGTTGNTTLISSLIKSSRSGVFATPSSVGSNSSSSSSLSSNSGLIVHNNNIGNTTQLYPIHGQSSGRQ